MVVETEMKVLLKVGGGRQNRIASVSDDKSNMLEAFMRLFSPSSLSPSSGSHVVSLLVVSHCRVLSLRYTFPIHFPHLHLQQRRRFSEHVCRSVSLSVTTRISYLISLPRLTIDTK